MNAFAYEQAARKHATGQKLTETEWETLLAAERAKQDRASELEAEIESLQAELDARDAANADA